MPRQPDSLSLDQARRLALAATGLNEARPTGRIDKRHLRRVMGRLGVIQLDSVNVMTRTHYMPFWSRLGAYDTAGFDDLARPGGDWFECWTHEASVIPLVDRPRWAWQHRRAEAGRTWKGFTEIRRRRPELVESLIEVVTESGPITAGDIDDPTHRNQPWWGWGEVKRGLEWLYRSGHLSAFRQGNFVRYYDLTERVIPRDVLDRPALGEDAALKSLLLSAAAGLGVGTQADLTDYFRLPKKETKGLAAELVEDGLLREVAVEGWRQPGLMLPDTAIPRRRGATALVSPFDPIVWNRERTERLFGFEYRIEIYVPADKRQYGYYVLPFLLDGELVARVDLKSDRKRGVLMVQSSWLEPGHEPDRVADALASELAALAAWRELDAVEIVDRGDLALRLRAAQAAGLTA